MSDADREKKAFSDDDTTADSQKHIAIITRQTQKVQLKLICRIESIIIYSKIQRLQIAKLQKKSKIIKSRQFFYLNKKVESSLFNYIFLLKFPTLF